MNNILQAVDDDTCALTAMGVLVGVVLCMGSPMSDAQIEAFMEDFGIGAQPSGVEQSLEEGVDLGVIRRLPTAEHQAVPHEEMGEDARELAAIVRCCLLASVAHRETP